MDEKPEVINPIPIQDVLDILKAQLEILKLIANPAIFIPESGFARDMRRR